MPTEVLAIGTNDTPSSDVTVDAGSFLTVSLKGPAGPGVPGEPKVSIQLKDDNGQYWHQAFLTQVTPGGTIPAGVWRFVRTAGSDSCGVFSA